MYIVALYMIGRLDLVSCAILKRIEGLAKTEWVMAKEPRDPLMRRVAVHNVGGRPDINDHPAYKTYSMDRKHHTTLVTTTVDSHFAMSIQHSLVSPTCSGVLASTEQERSRRVIRVPTACEECVLHSSITGCCQKYDRTSKVFCGKRENLRDEWNDDSNMDKCVHRNKIRSHTRRATVVDGRTLMTLI
ncbi:hypothetical protein SERLA73DRAFT_129115 [Serpula lacrymans var. lacrymans S7.3]|uniref:Uncharacterized protein n=1 Tax=Serpula lacrymans var. lacrymans (strain S7.3) TaxID=936435 RepID=F8PF68_SERL3|nr:hypothetical protein SERLA73DRAFT_129115 [Serpula lacrymans var. lacrymans S7.3]